MKRWRGAILATQPSELASGSCTHEAYLEGGAPVQGFVWASNFQPDDGGLHVCCRGGQPSSGDR